jgi:O-antigen ligase
MLFPMFAVCGLCLSGLILIRPAIGLIAVVACAAVVRVTVGTGTDSVIVASLAAACALVAGWAVHRTLHRQRLILLPRYVAIPGVLFIVFTIFSLMWGRITLDPRVNFYPAFLKVQIAATALSIVSVGLVFVGADLLRNRSLRGALVGFYIAAGFLALPLRSFPLGAIGEQLSFINTRGLFGLWFVSLCSALAVTRGSRPLVVRMVLMSGAIGWIMMAFFREGSWVSGWLPAALAMVFTTLLARPKIGIPLLIVVLIGVTAYYSVVYDSLITKQAAEGSLGGEFGRIELWQRNLEVIGPRVWLGTGPVGYALYYVTLVPNQAMSTHSNYVDVLAQNGVPGLLSLLGLLVGIGVMGAKVLRRITDETDRALCCAGLGGIPAVLVAIWFGDWLIPFVYNQTIAGFDHSVYSWLMFAALAGLYAQYIGDSEKPRLAHRYRVIQHPIAAQTLPE